MQIEETSLPGVMRLRPRRFGDARGWFAETWSASAMAMAGLSHDWVQDNESLSAAPGTVRGLHCQAPPSAQAKLVRCVAGAVRDVAVDARRGSRHYGRWHAEVLTAEGGEQLLIPRGFLHGFATLTENAHVLYKCDGPYDRSAERAVRFDDRDLAIDWGVDAAAVTLSEKDAAAPAFADFESPFEMEDVR